jgi:hypothetical protein
VPQNMIPTHNGVAAVQSAAGAGAPVQVHQGAPEGIPSHPGIQQQRVQADPPQMPRDPMADFFGTVDPNDTYGDESFVPEAPAQQQVSPPQSAADLVSVEDLLSGGQFPDEPQPVAPPQQQYQQQQQQQQVPVQQQYQQQQPVQQQAPVQQAPTPEDLQAQAIDYLRGNTYRLDDDSIRRALTEPEAVLPALAARVHVNVVHEMAQQMHRVLPMMIEQEVQKRTAVMEAKNEFYRAFPKLNNPAWEPIVTESIGLAAQMHRGKDRQTIMREGAALAAYRLRGQRQIPQAPNRGLPYQPAAPGGGGAVVPTNPSQSANPWADLANDPDLMNF